MADMNVDVSSRANPKDHVTSELKKDRKSLTPLQASILFTAAVMTPVGLKIFGPWEDLAQKQSHANEIDEVRLEDAVLPPVLENK